MISESERQEKLEAKRRLVEKAKKAAEDARKKYETLEAEFRGWEEAAACFNGESAGAEDNAAPKRGLSGKWKAVIAAMAKQFSKEFTLDEIGGLAAQNGIFPAKDTVRSQMHGYAEDELVKRVSPGIYIITPAGVRAAGVTLPSAGDETETAGADQAPAVP